MTKIETRRDGDVADVQFSSEKGINVFSSAVINALGEQIAALAEDRAIRYVVFRGSSRTFVAGADIKEMHGFDEDAARVFCQTGHRVFDAIESMPQVTFAAVTGHALGGGCELAMACDFRIMVTAATIGQPEARLGLIPGWGGTERLVRLVGRAPALKMMLGGAPISAAQALETGLVDEVVANKEELDAILPRWFALMRNGAPAAIDRIKRAVRTHDEVGEFTRCFSCDQSREGMLAFIEKRIAKWMQ